MRRVLLPLLVGVAAAASGCLEPYRVHVDAGALDASTLAWEETREPQDSQGWLGPKVKETRYTFDPDSAGPPFAGVLQVFSLRELNRRSTDELVAWTERIVAEASARESITVRPEASLSGERTLQDGLRTHWFVLQGTVTGDGALFSEDTEVRIVGEVGHDGRSRTSVVAVGLAQVSRTVQCPIIGPCQPTERDLVSWIDLVGDPEGSIEGRTSRNGLIDHLVTHG